VSIIGGQDHYDPLGRRIKKTVDGQSTWFVWDGTRLLGEYDNTGSRIKRYAYLPGDYLPIQMEDADGTYNVHGDHLQTPRLLTDPTAATNKKVVWRGSFEAFGTGVIDESPAPGPGTVNFNLRFPGQYFDSETGCHYNYFRYYDPEVGRYITSDPIGLDGGINTYAYVENDPVNFTDPFGLASGGKKNIGTEGFTRRSDPKQVEKALADAISKGQKKRAAALRALLKVIKRGGTMGILPINPASILIESCLNGDELSCLTLCTFFPEECDDDNSCS